VDDEEANAFYADETNREIVDSPRRRKRRGWTPPPLRPGDTWACTCVAGTEPCLEPAAWRVVGRDHQWQACYDHLAICLRTMKYAEKAYNTRFVVVVLEPASVPAER
jgi:hypothetical protein